MPAFVRLGNVALLILLIFAQSIEMIHEYNKVPWVAFVHESNAGNVAKQIAFVLFKGFVVFVGTDNLQMNRNIAQKKTKMEGKHWGRQQYKPEESSSPLEWPAGGGQRGWLQSPFFIQGYPTEMRNSKAILLLN
jgi:hypothetical protein